MKQKISASSINRLRNIMEILSSNSPEPTLETSGSPRDFISIEKRLIISISTRPFEISVHPNITAKWQREAVDGMKDGFNRKGKNKGSSADNEIKTLQAKFAELVVERDILARLAASLIAHGIVLLGCQLFDGIVSLGFLSPC